MRNVSKNLSFRFKCEDRMFVLSLSKNKVDQEVNQDLQMLVTKVIIVMQVEVEVLERYKRMVVE